MREKIDSLFSLIFIGLFIYSILVVTTLLKGEIIYHALFLASTLSVGVGAAIDFLKEKKKSGA